MTAAKTNAERQREFRQRKADTEATEVRGIFAHRHHEWDDDGCCVRCGFDGAEWRDWVMRVYCAMGWKEREARMPPCEEHR